MAAKASISPGYRVYEQRREISAGELATCAGCGEPFLRPIRAPGKPRSLCDDCLVGRKIKRMRQWNIAQREKRQRAAE